MKDSTDYECRIHNASEDHVEPTAAHSCGMLDCEIYDSIKDIDPVVWDAVAPSATGLRHGVLQTFESSEINALRCNYLLFKNEEKKAIAKANLYQVSMDFTSIDKNLSQQARHILKKWHPDFLNFSMIECGLFAMNGDGLVVTDNDMHESVIKETVNVMQKIADERNLDLLVMRDVPLERFDLYNDILEKKGFFPVSGFANAVLDIKWDSLDDFLDALNSKDRYKLKAALKIEEKYNIRIEITNEYEKLSPQMARLWKNVNSAATEYSREQLDEKFFRCAAQLTGKRSEVVAFYSEDRLVAFMWNLVGEEDYHMADWGVDYEFPQYKEANFYRVASLLSLERAMALGKKRMQLGITNYIPKKLLSAKMQPLVYFIKHKESHEYSRTVSRMMTDAIDQPEPLDYVENTSRWSSICATASKYKSELRRIQSDYRENDCLSQVESSYDISLLQVGGMYSFYPKLMDSADQIQLSGNNYTGSMHSEGVSNSITGNTALQGFHVQSSAFFSGARQEEIKLVELLCKTLGQESAVIVGSGYMSHLAALSVLARENVAVFMDQNNSPALWDAVKLGGAEAIAYSHLDYGHLKVVMAENIHKPALIVSEGIFALEGDQADINALCEIRNIFGARLYIDESCSFGFKGERGEGLCASLALGKKVDMIAGSFSQMFGLEGGFIAGSSRVIEHVKHVSSPLLISNGIPHAVLLNITDAISLRLAKQDNMVMELVDNSRNLAMQLEKLGYSIRFNQYPIINLILGDPMLALCVQKHCLNQGIIVTALIPPIVPETSSGIRLSLHNGLSQVDGERIVSIFSAIKKDIDESNILWN